MKVQRFAASADVVAQVVGEGTVLVHLGSNRIYTLNSTGGRLWALLSEGFSIDEATLKLLAEFDVERETLDTEVTDLISSFQEERLLVPRTR